MSGSPTVNRVLQSKETVEYLERASELIAFLQASDEMTLAAEQCTSLLERCCQLNISPERQHSLAIDLTAALLSTAHFTAADRAAALLEKLGSEIALPEDKRAVAYSLIATSAARAMGMPRRRDS